MARIRTIKPEFWSSEQISLCSRDARLLFIGLWTFCDDHGVHPASIMRLKMQVFPGDDCTKKDLNGWIEELLMQNLIIEFSHESTLYWHITGWEHQLIRKPYYKYPNVNYSEITRNSGTVPVRYQCSTSTVPVPHLDRDRDRDRDRDITNIDHFFDKFWKIYPLKKSKAQAKKAFDKINCSDDILIIVMNAIEQQVEERKLRNERGMFNPEWKHASTWLNNQCWTDEVCLNQEKLDAEISSSGKQGSNVWSHNS